MFLINNSDGEKAFLSCEAVFDRYGDMLFRICFSILVNNADAEDAVQDVFYKYMTKQPFFRDEDHRKAWLIRVATNRCKDMLRSRRIRSSVPLEEIEEHGVEQDEGEVLSLVFGLPIKYREAIVLHYFEGYGISEIADMLSLSESAVKMRLSRGRELLKADLDG